MNLAKQSPGSGEGECYSAQFTKDTMPHHLRQPCVGSEVWMTRFPRAALLDEVGG